MESVYFVGVVSNDPPHKPKNKRPCEHAEGSGIRQMQRTEDQQGH